MSEEKVPVIGLTVFGGLLFVVMFGLALVGRWINLQVEGWFQPREANVRREVFENTKSFNEGKEQELAKVYKEYQGANEEAKAGLREYVTHTFADYPVDRLDPALQNFVRLCRGY